MHRSTSAAGRPALESTAFSSECVTMTQRPPAGPRRLLYMKTTLGEQFAASVGSRAETWLRRTTTRM